MQIVHVQTNVQVVFGLLDENGDVVTKQPVNFELNKLSAEAFAEAYKAVEKAKGELAAKLESVPQAD